MRFTLEIKIIVGFCAAILILIILGYYSYSNNKNFIETSRSVSHTHEVLFHTEQILTISLDIETGQRGYVITGNEKFLEPHIKALQNIEDHILQLKNLTLDNPQQQKQIKFLEQLIQRKIASANKTISARRTLGIDSANKLIMSLQGQYLMDQIRGVISAMQAEEHDLLSKRHKKNEGNMADFNFTFIGLLAGIVLVLIAVSTLTLYNLKRLNRASSEIYDLYNNAPCGYHSLDPNGTLVEINDTELNWIGYQREEVLHKLNFSDLLTPESKKTLAANFSKFKKDGFISDLEFDMLRKDGTLLPVILNSSAIYSKDGQYLKSRSTLFDNTESKKTHLKINQLNKDLEKNISQLEIVNGELESFSYSVSHDLRAPLRSIAGYAQILNEDYADKLDEEGKKTIDTIVNNARRMGQLIDDLLAFSRFGKTELVKTKITMDKLIHSIVYEFQQEAGERKVEVKVNPLEPANVDITLIKQVWINLISNAFKYSNRKEITKIEIGAYIEKNENVYYIKDNGVGFDMEYSHKLFGVFQRLHKMKEFEGTGVGLAIVQRIIQRHGGKVWAEAKVNEGASFFFSLPLN